MNHRFQWSSILKLPLKKMISKNICDYTFLAQIIYSFLLLCRIFHMLERGQKQGRAAVS